MERELVTLAGERVPCLCLHTVVVGSGAAGFAAAVRLHDLGVTDIAVVTDGVNAGTSRNAGSDKQTYYKLTLAGNEPDSVRAMARTLFDGGCVDGDNALCEAALSAPCFLRLCELGVPFPHNAYGEYVGYKTDHDPLSRAASAGPYTSRMMTGALQRAVEARGVPILDGLLAIRVLTAENRVAGLLCLRMDGTGHAAFVCENIVLATGGPAGIYADSAYPEGHYGASALAFEAGAAGQNLTEWQYGLASLHPRWNVSGTYMQALPRFLSTDENGADRREFLPQALPDLGELLTKVFLKGYQWPFDAQRAETGSSIIDLLVHRERQRGRRVFLDFRSNPGGGSLNFSLLSKEAGRYLERAGAAFGAPIDRLLRMNAPAVDFYRDRGVDLSREPLEITFCAQHCNGGVAVDANWQTRVTGLYACGEVSGTHGARRPGGSALNETQAGAARAAQSIAARRGGGGGGPAIFARTLEYALREALALEASALSGGGRSARSLWSEAAARMSRWGGAVREEASLRETLRWVDGALSGLTAQVRVPGPGALWQAYRCRDALITQRLCLAAMLDYLACGGGSRGGALYPGLPMDAAHGAIVQEARWQGGECRFSWRSVRPIPPGGDVFETVWQAYREGRGPASPAP